MPVVLHAGQLGVLFLNNFALAEQWQNSERLNFIILEANVNFRRNKNYMCFLFFFSFLFSFLITKTAHLTHKNLSSKNIIIFER